MSGKENKTKQPPGFTLIEMTVVLFLVALMVGLSSILMADRLLPLANLDAAARDMAATLRRARALALANGDERKVVLDFDSRDCSLEGVGSWKIPAGIGVAARDPLYGDVGKGKYEIRFAANGGSQCVDLVLWNIKRILVVRQDPVLGAVTIGR